MRHYPLVSGLLFGSVLFSCVAVYAEPSSAASKTSLPQKVALTLRKNFLPTLLATSAGTEKKFLETLQKSDDQGLMKNLDLIQALPSGQTPFYLSEGMKIAELRVKRLTWQATIGQGNEARQVFLFDPQLKISPGWQPLTLILVDKDFKVLSWLESGGSSMFGKAMLRTTDAGATLETQSNNRTGGFLMEHFSISPTRIEKVDSRIEHQDQLPFRLGDTSLYHKVGIGESF